MFLSSSFFFFFFFFSKDTHAFTFVVVVIVIIVVTVVVAADYIFKRLVCHGCQRPRDRICGVWPIHLYPALRLQLGVGGGGWGKVGGGGINSLTPY